MKEWLDRVQDSLDKTLAAVETGVSPENMYMLAPIFYSKECHMNNERGDLFLRRFECGRRGCA